MRTVDPIHLAASHSSIADFFAEADEVFGFFLDVEMACRSEKARIEAMQRKFGCSDDSTFMIGTGDPQYPPEQEARRALHVTKFSRLKERLGSDGSNVTKAAEAAVVFVYQLWEEKYRWNLSGRDGLPLGKIDSDIMGDLRLLRNSIIHNKGIAKDDIVRCKIITKFKPAERSLLTSEDICTIFRTIRAELGRYL